MTTQEDTGPGIDMLWYNNDMAKISFRITISNDEPNESEIELGKSIACAAIGQRMGLSAATVRKNYLNDEDGLHAIWPIIARITHQMMIDKDEREMTELITVPAH